MFRRNTRRRAGSAGGLLVFLARACLNGRESGLSRPAYTWCEIICVRLWLQTLQGDI
jgi:hypothetical protein